MDRTYTVAEIRQMWEADVAFMAKPPPDLEHFTSRELMEAHEHIGTLLVELDRLEAAGEIEQLTAEANRHRLSSETLLAELKRVKQTLMQVHQEHEMTQAELKAAREVYERTLGESERRRVELDKARERIVVLERKAVSDEVLLGNRLLGLNEQDQIIGQLGDELSVVKQHNNELGEKSKALLDELVAARERNAAYEREWRHRLKSIAVKVKGSASWSHNIIADAALAAIPEPPAQEKPG